MKKLALLAFSLLFLSGCRVDTIVQGEGRITSPSGSFDCNHSGGNCTQQYSAPVTEILTASPSPGYVFTGWKGCSYLSLQSCDTPVTQSAIEDDLKWTVTAQFEPVQPPIQETTYSYNALGQRITKTVEGITTIFQYDLEGKLIAELDATGRPVRQHIHLNEQPVAQVSSDPDNGTTSVQYAHTDHLGTPTLLTDENQNVVVDIESTGFGEGFVDFSTVEYFRRFPGQYKDKESGLNYNYFRDYDPTTGRYVQSDPLGLEGGLNTYAYVGSNPFVYADPYGLEWYRPASHPFKAGREGSPLVQPGYGGDPYFHGGYIDDYVPAGHTFATYHDELVGFLVNDKEWPDLVANIPTMSLAYTAAFWRELLNSLGITIPLPDPSRMHDTLCSIAKN